MSESDSYPKAEFFRKPNLSKNSPNGPKCGLNTRHDNREVTWSDSYIQFFRKPNLSEYLPNVPKCGLYTRHDNREVIVIQFFRKPNLPELPEYLPNVPKCGLNTRHDNREVTLNIHLKRAHTLRSDKCATGLIHANGSMTTNVIPC